MRPSIVLLLVFAAGMIVLAAAPASASGAYAGYFELYPSSSNTIEDCRYSRAADLDHNGRDELITSWDDYATNGSYVQVRTFGAAIWESSQRTILQLASQIGYKLGRVAVADLDHDGDLDLIVPVGDSLYLVPTITVANFGPPSRLYVPGMLGVAAADLDLDGIVDLVASLYPNRVQILRGTGPVTFESIGEYPTHRWPDDVDIADFNGDGIPDLLVGADTASTVLVGDGTGGFSATEIPLKYAVSAGDLNEDGFADVISTSASCLSAGDGSFQPPVPFPALVAVVTTDLDEDGRLDLVGVKSTPPSFLMSVQHGLGDGTFSPAALYPGRVGSQTLVAGDFDGDGHQDVAQPGLHATDRVVFGLGNGLFPGPRVVPSGMRGAFLRAGEFGSHTGKDLLIVSSATHSMGIMHRTGLAQWSLPDTVALPGVPAAWGPEVADLNGDGRDDVVLAYDDIAVVSYWLTDATGHLGPRVDLPEPNAVYTKTIEIAVGDVDGDGDADILYQPTFNGGVQLDGIPLGWYLGAGDGTFTYNGTLPYITLGNLEIRDLNDDGLPDLAMVNRARQIRVVLASAPGVFGSYTDLGANGSVVNFVVGRLDGDATLDLAFSSGATWLFHGNGNGTFAAPVGLPWEAAFPTNSVTRDLDGDGRDEIVFGARYVRLNPDGTFDGAVYFGVSGDGVALDVDDNGSLDLVMTGNPELSLKLLLSKAGVQVLGVKPPRANTSGIRLTALRNPSRGEIVVRLSSERGGPASLELFDLLGRRLGRSTSNTMPGASRTVTLRHASALASGVYMVVARQAHEVVSMRITVLR